MSENYEQQFLPPHYYNTTYYEEGPRTYPEQLNTFGYYYPNFFPQEQWFQGQESSQPFDTSLTSYYGQTPVAALQYQQPQQTYWQQPNSQHHINIHGRNDGLQAHYDLLQQQGSALRNYYLLQQEELGLRKQLSQQANYQYYLTNSYDYARRLQNISRTLTGKRPFEYPNLQAFMKRYPSDTKYPFEKSTESTKSILSTREEPPVTKARLSEFEVNRMLRNFESRHKTNFDPVHYKPNLYHAGDKCTWCVGSGLKTVVRQVGSEVQSFQDICHQCNGDGLSIRDPEDLSDMANAGGSAKLNMHENKRQARREALHNESSNHSRKTTLQVRLEEIESGMKESISTPIETEDVKTATKITPTPSGLNISELNIRELNIRELNIRELNIRELNIRELNIRELNISKKTVDCYLRLSKLDVNKIVHNPKLRHDINFDINLRFRLNLDGEKGPKRGQKAKHSWETMRLQIQGGLTDREQSEKDNSFAWSPGENDLLHPLPWFSKKKDDTEANHHELESISRQSRIFVLACQITAHELLSPLSEWYSDKSPTPILDIIWVVVPTVYGKNWSEYFSSKQQFEVTNLHSGI
ncbi:Protein SOSEKI 1 [Ciborinia camelliae]|nr:Protein SOSEKI 1 [Ciborinia camelliae]